MREGERKRVGERGCGCERAGEKGLEREGVTGCEKKKGTRELID